MLISQSQFFTFRFSLFTFFRILTSSSYFCARKKLKNLFFLSLFRIFALNNHQTTTMQLTYLLYLIIGIALGALAVFFAMRAQVQAGKERIALTEQQKQQEGDSLRQQMRDQQETFRQQMQAMQESQQQQMRDGRESFQQQLRSQQESQQQQMQQQMALLREQMSTTSERVLKERAAELSAVNSEQLSKILDPLQDDLRQMRSQTEKMQKEHDDSLRELKTAIQVNMERERAMGEQTERLAQALTGDNKAQGNFGELKLTQILEQMELERGLQYDIQVTLRDKQGRTIKNDDGQSMIPDAILHFPDGRDVIIDSTRTDKGKLDFVLMYVFQESALQLALQNDTTLWKEAYDQGVVISGSQSLYMTLRVLELTWKQTRQVENQEKIMECANTLVERVQLFAERFAKADKFLDDTRKAFNDINISTAPSGKSITTAARNLLKFGAQENKKKKSLNSPPTLLEDKEEEEKDDANQVE